MRQLTTPRALVVATALAALTLTSACSTFPSGPPPCISDTTATLGVPFDVCLPETDSRVPVTLTLSNPIVSLITCSEDALVKTAAADNFGCGSWNSNSTTIRTINPGTGNVEFGVNPYTGDPLGSPPGHITVTITAAP